jgi:hypothetical protein
VNERRRFPVHPSPEWAPGEGFYLIRRYPTKGMQHRKPASDPTHKAIDQSMKGYCKVGSLQKQGAQQPTYTEYHSRTITSRPACPILQSKGAETPLQIQTRWKGGRLARHQKGQGKDANSAERDGRSTNAILTEGTRHGCHLYRRDAATKGRSKGTGLLLESQTFIRVPQTGAAFKTEGTRHGCHINRRDAAQMPY